MFSPRSLLILGVVVAVCVALGLFRGGTGTDPAKPSESAASQNAPGASNPDADATSKARWSLAAKSAHEGIEPLPELATPNLGLLRPEREALYGQLVAETNAALAEVDALLRPLKATDPGTLATAWTLANNWGIYSRGESTADQRVEDPEMRRKLADLHRRVLVESAESELEAFLGTKLTDDLRSGLETIGRKHAASASVRKPQSDPDAEARKEARRRAASGEDPLQEPK